MRALLLLGACLGLTFLLYKPSPGTKTTQIVTSSVLEDTIPEAIPVAKIIDAIDDVEVNEAEVSDFKAILEAISSLSEQVDALAAENASLSASVLDLAKKEPVAIPVATGNEEKWQDLVEEQQKINKILSTRLSEVIGEKSEYEAIMESQKATIDLLMASTPDIPEPSIINEGPAEPSAVNPTDKWPKYKNSINLGYMYANGRDMWGATYARNFTGFLGLYAGFYVDQEISSISQVYPVGGVKISFK